MKRDAHRASYHLRPTCPTKVALKFASSCQFGELVHSRVNKKGEFSRTTALLIGGPSRPTAAPSRPTQESSF